MCVRVRVCMCVCACVCVCVRALKARNNPGMFRNISADSDLQCGRRLRWTPTLFGLSPEVNKAPCPTDLRQMLRYRHQTTTQSKERAGEWYEFLETLLFSFFLPPSISYNWYSCPCKQASPHTRLTLNILLIFKRKNCFSLISGWYIVPLWPYGFYFHRRHARIPFPSTMPAIPCCRASAGSCNKQCFGTTGSPRLGLESCSMCSLRCRKRDGATGVMVFGAWYLMYAIGQVKGIGGGIVTAWQLVCGCWEMGVKWGDRNYN